jgi:hypothetical protein
MKIEELISLVNSLSSKEQKLIESHYRRINSNNRIKLVKFIVKGKVICKSDVVKFIFNDSYSSSAYSQLIKRVVNDILKVILIQDPVNIVRSSNFSKSLEVKKYSLYSELLYRRGLTDLGDYFIESGIEICEKYEFPIDGLILNEIRRPRYGVIKSAKEIEDISEISSDMLVKVNSLVNSLTLFNKFRSDFQSKNKLTDEMFSEGKIMIDNLNKIFEQVPLARNGYWFYRAAIYFYLRFEDYTSLELYGEKLLKLTKNSESINTPVNVAGLSYELAEIKLSSKDYLGAIENLKVSFDLFNRNLNNYLISLGTLFLANFHLENYDICLDVYEQAISHPKFKEKKGNFTIWNYYRACLYFKNGLYKEALHCLNQDASALALNKGEIFVFSKILHLFLLLETNKSILWSYELASFRKSFPSIKNFKIDRLKIIFSILNKLDREDFDFPYVEACESEKFEKLQVVPNIWKPLGFELISFESWFQEKTLAYNKTSKLKRRK